MRNNFKPETRELFFDEGWQMDWETGRNNADCLHHIMKRMSSSPYNAAPLNNFTTHNPEWRSSKGLPSIHSKETTKKFLNRTKKFLEDIEYTPDDKDLEFIKKYEEFY